MAAQGPPSADAPRAPTAVAMECAARAAKGSMAPAGGTRIANAAASAQRGKLQQ